ncbi:MAG: peptidoglycan DD-metalloendopeptidase family protein [Bacteroidetes bacterium]|nr:peptidoglycan DD-metalloendopeptidase family protein [Bacteroidota bacterium]
MTRFLLKKISHSIYICFILFFISVSSPTFSQTKTQPSQKDLQSKKNKLNDDIKQLNSQLSQTKASKKSQINTIVVINTKIKVREELIGTINSELAQINSKIKKNVAEVNSLKASLEKLKSEYAKMIYFAQRNQDSYTKIMFLFSAGNFNQAYMRIKYFQQEESAKIAAEKAAKAEKAEKNKTNKSKNTKPKTETPEVKAVAPELTAEAEAVGADFSSSRGKLPWPVVKGVICQPYGEYEHPAIKGFMMNNNGIEICANKGSQARAVFEGEVTSIAISPTGGKLIIIRHGEYLSVYSNIGDVFVKQGDKVTIKQTIGTILDEDGKTSMNLQIWKGQKTMDPSGWLFNAR